MSIKSTSTITRSEAISRLEEIINIAKKDSNVTNDMLGDALDQFYTFDNFLVVNDWEKEE